LSIASAPLASGTYRQGIKKARYCGKSALIRPPPHLPAGHLVADRPVARSIGANLASARLSLECDGEKRKQRVLESESRLQE
jgi:hypothetical protein